LSQKKLHTYLLYTYI